MTASPVIRFALRPMTIYRDGVPVRVDRGEPLTRADIGATFTPDRLKARDGRWLAETPPAPTKPESLTSAPQESDEHRNARLALETVVEDFAAQHSLERPQVREALEQNAESFSPTVTRWTLVDGQTVPVEVASSFVVDIPTTVRTQYRVLARELKRLEKKEAAQ